MTPFDLFQIATCQISAGERGNAAITLTEAIRRSGRDGCDADLRDSLVALRRSLLRVAK